MGKIIVLPVGEVILYIQLVYLGSSTQLKIPGPERLIVSQGQYVIMEKSLEQAYARLQEQIKTEMEQIEKRFAPMRQSPKSGEQ